MSDLKDKGLRDNERTLVLLKAKKLATAIHLVTSYLSDREPIKWQIRKKSIDLVSEVMGHNSPRALSVIELLMSLIDIVLHGQLGSEMNFSILKKEFAALRDQIIRREAIQLLEQTGERRPTPVRPDFAPQKVSSNLVAAPRPLLADNGSRRSLILNFIQQRGHSSIKDIAAAVPQVSAKTVQRELNALVGAGLARREGDRRWARYSPISQVDQKAEAR